MSRYSVFGAEGEFEPGSNGQVLANKLGVIDADEMADIETVLLMRLYERVLADVAPDQTLTMAMIEEWHRVWLGRVYAWAGRRRAVNLFKDGFPFAPAGRLDGLIEEFEHSFLARWTPCEGMDLESLLQGLAEVHVELIVIHPFREGNGRIARLLADVMASQAGVGVLDYSAWHAEKDGYIRSIHAGHDHDYAPMTALFRRALPS